MITFLILIISNTSIIKADENQIPTVTITSPNEGDIVSGLITITGTASDSDGFINITLVRFDDGSGGIATGTTNWSYTWDTTMISDGIHSIYAVSDDGINSSNIYITNVIVDNIPDTDNQIPIINILSPNNEEKISGETIITGTAEDNDGSIKKVEIRINAESWNTASGTNNWSYLWNTTTTTDGRHTIYARCNDGYNYSEVKSINITVKNFNLIPLITITYPNDNDIIKGQITVTGTAEDNDGEIQRVELKINTGTWETATGTTNWNYNWDTNTTKDGKHTIYAKSYDGEKHSNTISIKIIIDNTIDDENQIPTIKITHPLTGDNISGMKNIYGSSSDPDGIIQYVQIKIDSGPWTNATGTDLWGYTWDTINESNGEHIIYARSNDGKDYSKVELIIIRVNNKSTPGFEIYFLILSIMLSIIIMKSNKKNSSK
jgi:hypothetical protein